MCTHSVNGKNLYFVSFIDDYSGLANAYYLKHKNEAHKVFLEYKAWAENQTGQKIKKVRSDRGTEYTSKEFTDLLKTHGIEHHKSTPDSPQQNGRAERWNRTITDKALAMLHLAGLSHGFWELAVACAVHLYNRQPMRCHKWRTPIEIWCGKAPDVSYFRVFGCKAFVHVQKAHRHKLEKKALEMTFVGYAAGTKGYVFWNPAQHSIVVSCDVIFNENVFPARKLPGNCPVTPGDSPFPSHDSDDSNSSDSDSSFNGDNRVPELEIPLPIDVNPDVDPAQPPVQPEPEEAPNEPEPEPAPQQAPPVVPQAPRHSHSHHPPVGVPP